MNEYIECDTHELIRQIGFYNIAAISGGRILRRETGITLPVGRGYFVEIDLHASDTYVVKRVYQTSKMRIVKGEERNIYCEEIGETAYRASCFVNISFGKDTK